MSFKEEQKNELTLGYCVRNCTLFAITKNCNANEKNCISRNKHTEKRPKQATSNQTHNL